MNYDNAAKSQADIIIRLITRSDQKWRKDWSDNGFRQQNKDSTAYKGHNQLALFENCISKESKDPRWFTFNQIKNNGWKLQKGSKGSPIYFISNQVSKLKRDKDNNPILDKNGNKQYEVNSTDKPIFKSYFVFNGKDIEGVPDFVAPKKLSKKEQEKLNTEKYLLAEKIITDFCKENKVAFLEMPSKDAFFRNGVFSDEKTVVVPDKNQFNNLDAYYATAFHELGHATKILDIRINKETDSPNGNNFGSKNYAKEELTAELTSIFICGALGLDSTPSFKLTEKEKMSDREINSISYLKGWFDNGKLEQADMVTAVKEASRATRALIPAETMKKIEQTINKSETVSNKVSEKKSKGISI
ncbi:TPA: DUF1738 domain-containing protein [Providencia rettgeri]|nr:DUF1738 domain-containing protein [Providencia rettgeri]HEM7189757.1 DUF1738 domain-containing protein [Providencia rettgeri]